MSKELNKTAGEIAKTFFYLTERRATPATFTQTLGQARTLLKAGFNKFEIIEGIKYCVKNPPPKGFNSLGWLSYTLEDILKKLKIKHIKEEMNKMIDTPSEVNVNDERKNENRRSDSESRKRTGIDSKLFE